MPRSTVKSTTWALLVCVLHFALDPKQISLCHVASPTHSLFLSPKINLRVPSPSFFYLLPPFPPSILHPLPPHYHCLFLLHIITVSLLPNGSHPSPSNNSPAQHHNPHTSSLSQNEEILLPLHKTLPLPPFPQSPRRGTIITIHPGPHSTHTLRSPVVSITL